MDFTRRDVNRALLASAVALVARPIPVLAAPRPLFNFAIAGGFAHGLDAALPDLKPGLHLSLMREADNPYDANAVAVHGPDGTKLGYIPREANAPIAALMDAGKCVEAEILRMLEVRRARDIPDDLVFTGFDSGDPMIALSVRD